VLITFADPEGAMTKKLYKLYFDGELGQTASNEYRTVAIPVSAAKRTDAEALAKELGVELPKDGNPLIVAESADGKVLGTIMTGELSAKDGEIAAESLSAFLKKYALPQCDGQKLFDEALAQAKRENKRLLVQETATWCGPCHRLATFLDQNRRLWEKDFIWVRMDIRWSQASQIMKSLRGDAKGGYPWVAVVNADGKVLATSNNREGANIGFPTDSDEIDHFLQMLKSTAQWMSDDDFVQLKKALVDAQ
jgi:thiol-disulfide isomerase/thioredoxin